MSVVFTHVVAVSDYAKQRDFEIAQKSVLGTRHDNKDTNADSLGAIYLLHFVLIRLNHGAVIYRIFVVMSLLPNHKARVNFQ